MIIRISSRSISLEASVRSALVELFSSPCRCRCFENNHFSEVEPQNRAVAAPLHALRAEGLGLGKTVL